MEIRDINDIGNIQLCELADATKAFGILGVGTVIDGSTEIHFDRETFLGLKARFSLETQLNYAGLTETPYLKETCMLPGHIKLMSILSDEEAQVLVPEAEGQVA